jgi:ribonuclease Z
LTGPDRLTFPLEVTELSDGEAIRRTEYRILPYAVEHRGARALGYALIEDERRGRFNPDLARELGVPEGPLWGRLHRGQEITLPDGRVVSPETLVGDTRGGRTVVYTGDTRPCEATVAAARGADVLVHEATFGDEEAERARETGHSTAREAADIAARAEVRQLILTHVSARYSRDTRELEKQARESFAGAVVARDGMEVEVPFADEAPAERAQDSSPARR